MKFRLIALFAIMTAVAVGAKVFLVHEAIRQEAAKYADLKNPDPNIAISFANKIGNDRDEKAIPYLVAALNDRRRATEGSFSIHDGAPTVSLTCWHALRAIGEPAAATVGPMLSQLGKDNQELVNAIRVLSNCGDAAEPYILKIASLSQHEDMQVRMSAAWCLVNLESDSELLSKELLNLLDSEYINVRILGCVGLSHYRDKTKLFIPTLIQQLSHSDGTLRGIAAYTLGRFGSNSIDALPILRRLVEDDDFVFSGHLLEDRPRGTNVGVLAKEAIASIECDLK